MHALVDRTRLLARLHRSEPDRVTVITAPAGYGKTTLARQWARTVPHPVAHLAVSRTRAPAANLLTDILDALGAPGEPRVAEVIAAVTATVAERGALTLILDDFEHVEDAETLDAVNALIAGMPIGARVMVISRSTPRLTLARLRAIGSLCTLTETDLRFTCDEAAAALDGLSLTPRQVHQVVDRTEGWITGIRLAREAIASAATEAPIDDVLGALTRDHWLAQYFLEEVLDRLPAPLRELVLLSSAFPNLDPELCAAALGIDNAEGAIQDLALRGAFVTRVAPADSTLRYHRMFAEAIIGIARNELGTARLHDTWSRASCFLAGRGQLGDALELAARAQNWELATRYAVRFVQNPADQDRVDIVRSRLELLPRELLVGNDLLAHAYIQAASYAGNLRDAAAVADVKLPRWTESDDPELRGFAASTIGHRHVLDGDNQIALDHLYEALRLTPDDRVLDRLHTWTAVSHLEFLRNDTDAAEHAYREAARCRARLGRSPYMWEMYTRPDRANQLAMRGELRAAEEMYRDLYLYSSEIHQTPMSKPLAILASIYLEWRRLDEALETIARIVDDQEAFPYDVWRPEGLNLAAEVYLARGMMEEAAQSLHAAIALLRERGGTMHLRRARAIEARLWLRTGRKNRAREWAAIERHQPPLPARAFRDLDPRLALIEVFLDEGRVAEALDVASRGIDDSPSPNRNAARIRFLVWHAVALAMDGQTERSDMALRHALEIGARGAFVACFHPHGYDLRDQLMRERPRAPIEIQRYIDLIVGSLAGSSHTPPSIPHPAVHAEAGRDGHDFGLTPREREVLSLMQDGSTNRQIADRLFITERTAKKHIANISRKLDSPNRTAAVARAYEVGLLD